MPDQRSETFSSTFPPKCWLAADFEAPPLQTTQHYHYDERVWSFARRAIVAIQAGQSAQLLADAATDFARTGKPVAIEAVGR